MSKLKTPQRVKLVMAFFSKKEFNHKNFFLELHKKWGEIDYFSPELPFNETRYYRTEMGENLVIRIIAFKKLVKRSHLPRIKFFTNRLEKKYSCFENNCLKRTINIDPGLLSLENFILATGKGYSHRIYLKNGVWADLTLIYSKSNGYQKLAWTYPSYQNKKTLSIMNDIRKIYKHQLKKK